MESTESWKAMVSALAGHPPNRCRVLRLEEKGPGSREAIERYVRTVIEKNATLNRDASPQRLAETITTSVLNRLGAGLARPYRP